MFHLSSATNDNSESFLKGHQLKKSTCFFPCHTYILKFLAQIMLYQCINKWNTVHSQICFNKTRLQRSTWQYTDKGTDSALLLWWIHSALCCTSWRNVNQAKLLSPKVIWNQMKSTGLHWDSYFTFFFFSNYHCKDFKILFIQWCIFLHTILNFSVWPFLSSIFTG